MMDEKREVDGPRGGYQQAAARDVPVPDSGPDASSWAVYNSGENLGNIVQGRDIYGNVIHSPKSREEVNAKEKGLREERDKFLRAERSIKSNVILFTGVGGPLAWAVACLKGHPGTIDQYTFGVGAIGVVIHSARLMIVRSKREKLSKLL